MSIINLDSPGQTVLLMGNEAIARGALEGGIKVATAYPGTPSSEIIGSLAEVAKEMDIYVEWSANEKVALEVAVATSMAGLRSIVAMKQNGLNVASDSLFNFNCTGVKAGIVLVVCDDPSGYSSSNEQDTRAFARIGGLPLLEPSNFQEAKDMVQYGLELSEDLKTIVIVRGVTRISHARGNVTLGNLPKLQRQPKFDVNSPFLYAPVVQRHTILNEKLAKAKERFETSPFNSYEGPDNPILMVAASGTGIFYTREAISLMGVEDKVGILKMGTTWPLPERFIGKHLAKVQKVMVVEEVESFLETNLKEIWADLASDPQIGGTRIFYGKRSGHIPLTAELTVDRVVEALKKVLEVKYEPRDANYTKRVKDMHKEFVPDRVLGFCPGCPHRASLWAIKNALRLDGREGFLNGDVGCYALARIATGFNLAKTTGGMGNATGLACGFGKLWQFGFDQPTVAVCGDSTFYHAAMPALVNAQYTGSNFVMCILDNSGTAMTGFQPHPGVGLNAVGDPAPIVDIEKICRAMDAKVEIHDPFDVKGTIEILTRLMQDEEGVKVLILKRKCALIRLKGESFPYKVSIDPEKCIGEDCGCNRICTRIFRCPGLVWDIEAKKSKVDEVICVNCGVCAEICPNSAIIKKEI
jgi:indolepyruvate ferredoxin oxidoreductase alpha subunit